MADVPILVVTGNSGSGKTTLIERLVPELRRRGYRVGVVKHHGHVLDLDTRGKDSDRFWQAGAEAVAMVAPDRTVVMWRPGQVAQLQALAQLMTADLVLAEGFKSSDLPRLIVTGGSATAAEELGAGRTVVAVVAPDGGEGQLGRDDIAAVADRVVAWLRARTAPGPG